VNVAACLFAAFKLDEAVLDAGNVQFLKELPPM
jgi:hypothetical protein